MTVVEKHIFTLIIGTVLGFGGGYVFFGMAGIPQGGMMHQHMQTLVSEGVAPPTLSLELTSDAKDGYNLFIQTENFIWTPERVNGDVVQGEGHGHVYINGRKIARVYGPWFHIGSDVLREGENVIEVTLNAHDHGEWVVDGERVSDSVSVSL